MTSPRPRLVLGLGNPGPEYEGTRHNVGFDVLDRVAQQFCRPFLTRGRALVARGEAGQVPFVLAKPTTYMNRSGRAARDLLADLGGQAELLVLCDDFHLELGRLRCRLKGSAGGQKGLASIIELWSDGDVPRLRLGIGDPGRVPAEEYVLRPFKRSESDDVARMLDRAAAHVARWLEDGDSQRLVNEANAPSAEL